MNHDCTVYKTMDYLSKKWTVMIMLELYKNGGDWKRFSTIMASMKDVTPKIMTERLKELEREGLVENRVDSTSFPIKSEYRLTASGIEFMEVIRQLKSWALKWKIENEPCKNQDCRICDL